MCTQLSSYRNGADRVLLAADCCLTEWGAHCRSTGDEAGVAADLASVRNRASVEHARSEERSETARSEEVQRDKCL